MGPVTTQDMERCSNCGQAAGKPQPSAPLTVTFQLPELLSLDEVQVLLSAWQTRGYEVPELGACEVVDVEGTARIRTADLLARVVDAEHEEAEA